MPKATAIWLIENTTLTFEQIGGFCGMHPLEVQGIADGDVAVGIIGQDPVAAGQISAEDLEKSIDDAEIPLKISDNVDKYIKSQQKKKGRYTPVARRQDKPDAVAWLVKNYPNITDAQIGKLIGTTKSTIKSVRERSHWNMTNIRPRDPVLLGLCTQSDLHAMVEKVEASTKAIAEKSRKKKSA